MSEGSWQTLEIINGRVQSKTIVAQIKNINDREQARKLIGTDIYIEKSQLPKLKKGFIFCHIFYCHFSYSN
jgi:16S rRNA processing protein RimM